MTLARPGPMQRTRQQIIEVEAAADLTRRLERSGGALRRRGRRQDRLAMRTPEVPTDGASDEQDGEDGVGEDRQGPGERSA
jgi:hypothetical protein